MLILASASSDLSQVPPEFLKWFMVCVLALGAAAISAWVAYRKGTRASGTKDEPVNIAMPVDVRKVPEYANKSEVEKLRARIEEVMAAGAERRLEILNAVHGSEQRTIGTILQEVKTLHDRLNPIVGKVEAHGAQLNHINADNLRQGQDIAGIRRNVEELLKTSAKPSKRS